MILNLLLASLLVASVQSQCSNPLYPYSFSGGCYGQCPWSPSAITYLTVASNTCVTACTAPLFADDLSRTCLAVCPSSPILTFYDLANRKCVRKCSTNPRTLAWTGNNTCVTNCPSPAFADEGAGACVSVCPLGTFYQVVATLRLCVSRCYQNYYADYSQTCVAAAACPTAQLAYYADDSTNLCVTKCPSAAGTFADNSTSRCLFICPPASYADPTTQLCVATCPTVPPYFGSALTRSCLLLCNEGEFADNATRTCASLCTLTTFGDYSTRTCVAECPFSQGTFADPVTQLCIATCSPGYYADNASRDCVLPVACAGSFFADPLTSACVAACPLAYFADPSTKTCVARCSGAWGDPDSGQCVSACPWNPPLFISFQDPSTDTCVQACPAEFWYFGDPTTHDCVTRCPLGYFGTRTTHLCVETCPTGFFSEPASRLCLANCTSNSTTVLYFHYGNMSCIAGCPSPSFADNTTLSCVSRCPADFYGHNNLCLSACPSSFFADDYSQTCVPACPLETGQFADIATQKCVSECPESPDLYGQDLNDGNRSCVATCVRVGFFADPLTRRCVDDCNTTAGYYGYLTDNRCYARCPAGFADPVSKVCVATCPINPDITFGDALTARCVSVCPNNTFGNSATLRCVTALSCPTAHFADDLTQRCVPLCSQRDGLFGDPIIGKCVRTCTYPNYADNTTQLCSASCAAASLQFKDPSTLRCVRSCPSIPDFFADPNTMTCVASCSNSYFAYVGRSRVCVEVCPSSPAYFGDEQARRCVTVCANGTYKYATNSYRGCVATCPVRQYDASLSVPLFADNSSWTCVEVCPQGTYSFLRAGHSRNAQCVAACFVVAGVYYFAEEVARQCVTECPWFKHGTFGDRIELKCVAACSRKQYRDAASKLCVSRCSAGLFADNSTFDCVEVCPDGTFAESTNRSCVRQCPNGSFGYNQTCLPSCPVGTLYYKDNTTWLCVEQCPSTVDYYIDFALQACVLVCSGDTYADPNLHQCLPALNCTDGLFADPTTFRCVDACTKSPMYFWEPSTNLCSPTCDPPLFADNATNLCVEACVLPYANVNTSANYYCTQFCPIDEYRYIDSGVAWCVRMCPPGSFADNLTWNCVSRCPDRYYAVASNRTCMLACTPLWADDLSKSCVSLCPDYSTASNNTYTCQSQCDFGQYSLNKVCLSGCPSPLLADNLTRSCVSRCPYDPLSYGDSVTRYCVFLCNATTYAYLFNLTCLPACPDGHFKELSLRVCLQTCLQGQFGDPSSTNCVASCSLSTYSFADPTTQQCVRVCPSSPDLFGLYNVCKTRCPTGRYAQNFTRTCVAVCPNISATILNASFADPLTSRCLRKCSRLYYGHVSQTENLCVQTCPTGFASDDTQTCVAVCPAGTFSLNTSSKCVSKCPPGLWGDLSLRICMPDCTYDTLLFADDSKAECVQNCPSSPNLFADSTTHRCVLSCRPNFYADNDTRSCVGQCTAPYFADDILARCVLDCPLSALTFADSQIRKCMPGCINYTIGGRSVIFYSDNSSRACVTHCPRAAAKLYGLNSSNKCVDRCPSDTYADDDTLLCLDRCIFESPKFTWMDSVEWRCVKVCADGYFADNSTGVCQAVCSAGTYADPASKRCVYNCPNNPQSYGVTVSTVGVCVLNCPRGLYADEISISCAPTCPTTPFFYFTYTPTNKCVKECVFPYFGKVSEQACTTACAQGEYGNLTTKQCEKCQTQCVTCQALLQCNSCVSGFFLFEFSCVLSCPFYPVLYYSHIQSATCFAACPPPFFGENTTASCQLSCPTLTYASVATRVCTACPAGCLTCAAQGCFSCLQAYALVDWNASCNAHCNATFRYFAPTACALDCPAATFLTSDLVTCAACSLACSSCFGTAANCTACNGKMYYQGVCVDACPPDYFVDSIFSCQPCASFPAMCVLPPLNYTVSPFVANYKLQAFVVFNRAVRMTVAAFTSTVQIRYNGKVVAANAFEASVFNSTTFLVVFSNSNSLNQNALSFYFPPGSVIDTFGNSLTVNNATTTVTIDTGVNAQVAASASSIVEVTTIISLIFLIIIALSFIKTSYPALLTIETAQLLYLHTFLRISPIPYLQYKFSDAISSLSFTFFPHITGVGYTDKDYYVFLPDCSLLYSISSFLFFMGMALVLYFVFWMLTSKKCVGKGVRKVAKRVKKHRLKYHIIFDALWITMPYILFLACLQLPKASFGSTFEIINFVGAILVLLVFVIFAVTILRLSLRYSKMSDPIPRKYSFIMLEDSDFPFEMGLRVVRKALFCVFLLLPEVEGQAGAIMMANAVFLIYLIIYRPPKSKLTFIVTLAIQVSYICLEALYIAYSRTGTKDLATQTGFAIGMIIVQSAPLVIAFLWLAYRFFETLRTTDCWKAIVAKITRNTDPQYLQQQQHKRDLEFDFGELDRHTEVDQSDGRPTTNDKFNIFNQTNDKLDNIVSRHSSEDEKIRPLSASEVDSVKVEQDKRKSPQPKKAAKPIKKNYIRVIDNEKQHNLSDMIENGSREQPQKSSKSPWQDIDIEDNDY